ncbi:MAG: response regulator [Balneolaceae bacterium]|nr:MAG: response regulator [Balneolaceae bacterium]
MDVILEESKLKFFSILIVEDDFFQAVMLDKILTSLHYTVIGKAKSGEEAIQLATELKPDLIFMDISLDGEMDGITAAMKIQEKMPASLIYNTGNSDEYHRKRAEATNYLAYLVKPVTREIIANTLRKLERIS